MVRLALYKGKGKVGNALIRWWTRSIYSHCELVVGELSYSSSLRDGGVRVKRIDFDSDHWDFIDLPWVSAAQVIAYAEKTRNEPYGWRDLIWRQIFNRPGDSYGHFCAEWCGAAMGLPNPQSFSPATLGEYCKSRIA